jgi:hypothetical protein
LAVLDDHALSGTNVHLLSGVQEEVWCRLAALDMSSAVDPVVEVLVQDGA